MALLISEVPNCFSALHISLSTEFVSQVISIMTDSSIVFLCSSFNGSVDEMILSARLEEMAAPKIPPPAAIRVDDGIIDILRNLNF